MARMAALAGACLLLFSIGISRYDLWPADEPRYGEVAREMMLTGDYLAPHVNGSPYREKPPLLFWSIVAVSLPFGEVTETSARIPSIVAAMITLMLTFALARRLFDERTAFLAVVILATAGRFWWQARTVQIDMVLTACVTAAIYSLWRWHNERKAIWLVGMYLAIALALLAKGPPGLVFPLLLIFAFYWKQRDERRSTHWLMGTAGAIALVAMWLIPARASISVEAAAGAEGAISSNLFRQTLGRFVMGVSHAEPPWYYIENLPVDLLPWTLFLPFTLIYAWKRKRENQSMRFLFLWIVPAFIFFSISIGKRALYLLPLYPAIAILIARSIFALDEEQRSVWVRRTGYAWAVFVLMASAAPLVVPMTPYAESFSPALLWLTAAGIISAVFWRVSPLKGNAMRLAGAVALHAALLQGAVATTVLPIINDHKSARSFCEPMRLLNETHANYDLFSLGFSREEYVFYSKRFHTPLVYGLLDIEMPPGTSGNEAAKLQVHLRKTLSRAMRDIEIESYDALTRKEVDALDAARQTALESEDLGEAVTESFEAALHAEVKPLFEVPERIKLVMVQEEDYKWLRAFLPELKSYVVVTRQSVGSREMLLLANESAQRARHDM